MARGRCYPISTLDVGESVLIPWVLDERGAVAKDQDKIHAAVRQEQRRYRKRFDRRGEAGGIRVTRVE